MSVVRDSGERATLPPFGAEHEELRQTVARFVTAEIAPHVDEWEAARGFPDALFGRCAELGFLGLKFPEAYGGQGGDHLHDAIWVEELARSGGSGGVAAGLNAHASIALPPIFNFGTEAQKQRWLVPGIAGEKIGALGITEPGAGSDVAGITTTAQRIDGGYLVNGAKTFITNGVRADFLVCACKTSEEGGHGGISFLVLEREAFGRPIGKFQAIRHQVAEMATAAEAARALTYNALRLFHTGQDCIREVSMAKLVTQRTVLEIADQSLQIHGGYGYMREYGIERAVRDARLGPIGGGTDEIMKEILGKTMGL